MIPSQLIGLIAATYTPLRDDGSLNLEQVGPMVDYLLENGVGGLYVCGSTGEGMSLSSEERRSVADAYVQAAAGRTPVIIQVGHNSISEAKQLAEHAQRIGADAVSATCPSYFEINNVDALVDCMSQVASGAPELPFYYYHIPVLTGSTIGMVDFLQRGGEQIRNLAGLKYTAPTLHEFQECLEMEGGRFDVVWGVDEMLLGALATGARAAIGSTYNIAAPLYREIINAFNKPDLDDARRLQSRSWSIIKAIAASSYHPAMKEVLRMLGFEFGRCRAPQQEISAEDIRTLRRNLESIGFFDQTNLISEPQERADASDVPKTTTFPS